MKMTRHKPGTPSWVDLASPDVEATKAFYTGLFGWQAYASPKDSLTNLAVTISGLGADAQLDHFLIPSKTSLGDVPAMGSVYFAARVGEAASGVAAAGGSRSSSSDLGRSSTVPLSTSAMRGWPSEEA